MCQVLEGVFSHIKILGIGLLGKTIYNPPSPGILAAGPGGGGSRPIINLTKNDKIFIGKNYLRLHQKPPSQERCTL